MGSLSTCCRLLLIIINIFFLILGLVFFALGLFIRFGSAILDGYIDTVKKSIEESASSSGLGTVTLDLDLSDVLFGVAIGCICFGLFMLMITFLGCFGGCCKQRCMLITYLVICVVLLVGQIVVIGILYGSPDTFHDPAKARMKDDIKSEYMGLNGTNLNSMAWNVIMQKMKCCGPNSFADFTGATNWVVDYQSTAGVTLKTPLACCITLPSSTDYSCASASLTGATDANNYQSISCYDTIWDKSLGNTAIMVGTLVGVGVLQLTVIVSAVVMCVAARKNKTAPIQKNHLV